MQQQNLASGDGTIQIDSFVPYRVASKDAFQSPPPNNQSYDKQVSYWSRAHYAT